MLTPVVRRVFLVFIVLIQIGCSSGGGDDSADGGTTNPSDNANVTIAPVGEITHYGAITLADDAGEASDIVGSFYKLDTGVSAEFATTMLSGQSVMCQVQDDGVIDFEEISAVYIPTMPGIGNTAVSAGESIVLTSSAGTFATLDEQPAAGFLFYDLPNMAMLMDGPLPDELTVDVAGSDEIPAFSAIPVPAITPLAEASFGPDSTISANTQFTWEASGDPSAMIRIFSSTAGGFFLENGVTVTCVAPDTGSFMFPSDTQAQLGSDFSGSAPLISRLVVNPVRVDTTLLYVIRESFN